MPQKSKQEYNSYMNQYMKKRYKQRRQLAFNILGPECKICGSLENLELDHINPKTKTMEITKIWSCSMTRFLAEVRKCQTLCKEHHLMKSRLNGDFGGGHNRIDEYGHGTGHMYDKQKCRCSICREWKRKYRAKLVDIMGLKK